MIIMRTIMIMMVRKKKTITKGWNEEKYWGLFKIYFSISNNVIVCLQSRGTIRKVFVSCSYICLSMIFISQVIKILGHYMFLSKMYKRNDERDLEE
jgi:uncharacterized membrane protein